MDVKVEFKVYFNGYYEVSKADTSDFEHGEV